MLHQLLEEVEEVLQRQNDKPASTEATDKPTGVSTPNSPLDF